MRFETRRVTFQNVFWKARAHVWTKPRTTPTRSILSLPFYVVRVRRIVVVTRARPCVCDSKDIINWCTVRWWVLRRGPSNAGERANEGGKERDLCVFIGCRPKTVRGTSVKKKTLAGRRTRRAGSSHATIATGQRILVRHACPS